MAPDRSPEQTGPFPKDGFSPDAPFRQAAEDLSSYLWALESMDDPPEGYDPGYLFAMALSCRARSRRALDALEDLPQGPDGPYIQKLKKMWIQAEGQLEKRVQEQPGQIASLADQDMARMAAMAHGWEKEVAQTSRDADLFGSGDLARPHLRETAHGFLVWLAHLENARKELSGPLFEGVETEALSRTLDEVNRDLDRDWGFFHVVEDLVQPLNQRLAATENWWGKKEIDPSQVPDVSLPAPALKALSQAFVLEEALSPRNCPQASRTIAYSLGELDSSSEKKTREHLTQCRACRRLVLDTSQARKSSLREHPPQSPGVLPRLDKVISRVQESRDTTEAQTRPEPALKSQRLPWLVACVAVFLLFTVVLWPDSQPDAPPPAAPPAASPATQQAPDILPVQDTALLPGARKIELSLVGRRHRGVSLGGVMSGFREFPVLRGDSLKTGDGFQVLFSVDKDSYVYIFFLDSGQKMTPLLEGMVTPGKILTLPKQGKWFTLDDQTGTETIWVLAAGQRIEDFGGKLEKLQRLGIRAVNSVFPNISKESIAFIHK